MLKYHIYAFLDIVFVFIALHVTQLISSKNYGISWKIWQHLFIPDDFKCAHVNPVFKKTSLGTPPLRT